MSHCRVGCNQLPRVHVTLQRGTHGNITPSSHKMYCIICSTGTVVGRESESRSTRSDAGIRTNENEYHYFIFFTMDARQRCGAGFGFRRQLKGTLRKKHPLSQRPCSLTLGLEVFTHFYPYQGCWGFLGTDPLLWILRMDISFICAESLPLVNSLDPGHFL